MSNLSRKYYQGIADVMLREHQVCAVAQDNTAIESIITIVDDLANYFEKDNPRFDRDRFLEACGMTTEE